MALETLNDVVGEVQRDINSTNRNGVSEGGPFEPLLDPLYDARDVVTRQCSREEKHICRDDRETGPNAFIEA